MQKFSLKEIEWPTFGTCERPSQASAADYTDRLNETRAAMEKLDLTHLVVYGDREHFANLAYLTGFDPRFEEALLILDLSIAPLIVVGNECEDYLSASPLFRAGMLRSERFQPFSLLNQPRNDCRFIKDIFSSEGIDAGSHVGCVGWKYFSEGEHPDGDRTIDLPAYLVDTLRSLSGWEKVTNATAIFMHPGYGLRTRCSPSEIAFFEYTNILASEGMKRMLFGLQEGMTDHELARLSEYNGEPLGCHMTLAVGERSGLSGPVGDTIQRGVPLSTNLCYWGSNSCRAGWVAASRDELPDNAQDYVENYAGPYFETMAAWYQSLQLGTPGGKLEDLVAENLPFEKYGITLNAGHLIHLDEWVSSPIYPGSTIPLQSGMVLQVDVIPASPIYASTRMEDGVVLADGALRRAIQDQFPDCYERCMARRAFMTDVLGFDLPEEILPLSNIPGIVPPFFLAPNTVFALQR